MSLLVNAQGCQEAPILMKRYIDYFESYLNKHPQDRDMRYQYARSLEQDGHLQAALLQYEHAARLGNLAALIALKRLNLDEHSLSHTPPQRSRPRLRTILLLLLFLLLPYPLADATGSLLFPTSLNELKPVTLPNELPHLVVGNAVARYRTAVGSDPPTLGALVQGAPQNWLSFLPAGAPKSCPCQPDDSLLELHYYPATNQLALVRGDEVLALYPVASGDPLPFTQSKVLKRVVNPNGGRGGVGTRGFELDDNYAIHGTNRPELIGQRGISNGCLRMRNEDIEQLYPYVSLGTPFRVMEGIPGTPTFPDGLPPLGGPGLLTAEETPGVTYHWKQ
jgi:hypothetical protein